MSEDAEIRLWGRTIGAASLEPGERTAVFQYAPDFASSAIQVSPLTMPLRTEPYSFPELPYKAFKGLPGLLGDSLPDRYGNALIDAWLARQGREPRSANAIERLYYIGQRGTGALEFAPAKGPEQTAGEEIQIGELVELASRILADRDDFFTTLTPGREEEGLLEILSVGMSAGGARAKAVIAWNPDTNEVRSGQVEAPPGFQHWLLKFDGVTNNRDKERFADPDGYGVIEYAYSLMAGAAGDGDDALPAVRGERPAPLHDPTLRPSLRQCQAAHAVACRALPLRLQRPALLLLRAGADGDPPAGTADRGARAAVPSPGVQPDRAQPGRPRQEHRLPDGPGRRVVALTRLRRHLQLQPRRTSTRLGIRCRSTANATASSTTTCCAAPTPSRCRGRGRCRSSRRSPPRSPTGLNSPPRPVFPSSERGRSVRRTGSPWAAAERSVRRRSRARPRRGSAGSGRRLPPRRHRGRGAGARRASPRCSRPGERRRLRPNAPGGIRTRAARLKRPPL